jgi:hypothetical protein
MSKSVQSRRVAALLLAATLAATLGGAPAALGSTLNPPTIVFAGEVLSAPSYDHIVLVYSTHLDESVPVPFGDFTVTVDSVPHVPVAGTYLLSGLAGLGDPFDISGTTFIRLDLPPGVTIGAASTIEVSYAPVAPPLRDLSLASATAQTVDGEMADAGGVVGFLGAVVDSGNAPDRVTLIFTGQLDLGSIPIPADLDFTVSVNGSLVAITAIEPRVPDLGLGFLDLVLAAPVWSGDHVDVTYTPGATPLRARNGPEVVDGFAENDISLFMTSRAAAVSAGGTVSTGTGAPPDPQVPLTTTVTSPNAGTVTIAQTAVDPAPAGYTFFGQQVEITAPPATDASNPLVLIFAVDATLVPAGQDETSIVIFRNGVPVAGCAGPPSTADPSPCVASRVALAGGDIQVTVNTLAASRWNFAVVTPYAFGGFRPPVNDNGVRNLAKAGSAIPVKFSLGGDRGMSIFGAGSPGSQRVTCNTSSPIDEVEQTVNAGASSLSYSPAADQYTYVWKTDRGWAGTCRVLALAFSDGSIQRALFQFK